LNYDSTKEIKSLLESLGIRLKKRWGQNFLINRGVRQKIISLLDPQLNDLIWEIGPGLGSLTNDLLILAGKLLCFELDRGLIAYLQNTFAGHENFILIPGDVLKTWKNTADKYGIPDRVVGNLPYSSASAIIAALAENNCLPPRMIFTVQKELARRMTAPVGNKNYSSFSILCQFAFSMRNHGDIKPGSFFPIPEVTSTIVELHPRKDLSAPRDRALFLALLKSLFVSRRKTIRNNLLSGWAATRYREDLLLKALKISDIDPGIRGEELPVEAFIKLADNIQELG
jgi:16S rRNA (adenine1518-N6/adenine1519-N6)-dimethyltransferase